MIAKYLVHDIETVPVNELQWDPSTAPPTKTGEEPMAPVWAMRIVTIGMLPLDARLIPAGPAVCARGATEREKLADWSEVVANTRGRPLMLVDFNGRRFDMPVAQSRAFRYGITLDWYFDLLPDNRGEKSQWSKSYRDRYAGHHADLYEFWTNHGGFSATRLDHLARLMGLPGKVGFDGSQVHEAWRAGEHDRIDAYCVSDVLTTAFVFARIRLVAGRMSGSEYRTAVSAILECAENDPSQAEFVASIDRSALLCAEPVP